MTLRNARWRRLGVRRYPVWSGKAIALAMSLAVIVTAVVVFLSGARPPIVEAEITLGILALGLFAFLSAGLYRGVRVKKESLDLNPRLQNQVDVSNLGIDSLGDFVPDLGGEGFLAAIVALVLWILMLALLVVLLWLLVPLLWGAAVVLLLAVFWVFNRAMRQVFARSRSCRGSLPRSLGYAGLYTFLYTGWLFALLWIGSWVSRA